MNDIKLKILKNDDEQYFFNLSKYSRFLIVGDENTGKTTLLKRLYNQCKNYEDTSAYIISSKPHEFEDCIGDNFNLSHQIYSDSKNAINIIKQLDSEMNNRYEFLNNNGLKCEEHEFNRIILFIDDFSSCLKYIVTKTKLLQLGWAVGILIIATYMPSIKPNKDILSIFDRLYFKCSNNKYYASLKQGEFLYCPPDLEEGYVKGDL